MSLVLFIIAAILAALCVWIVVPPPVGPAIVASVIGIELSPYLLLLNAIVIIAAFRSRTRLKTATVVLAGLNVVLCSLPMAAIVRSGLELTSPIASGAGGSIIESAIPFTLGHDQTAILAYLPTAGSNNPIVFTVYGGAWQRGSPAKDAPLDRALAAAGYAVFALEYRHAPEYQFPVALHDIQSEVSSILKNADTYRADRTRAAILGHSSGGELAELCAFAPRSPIRALISYSGAIDLLKGYEILPRPDPLDVRSVIAAYMGFTPVGHSAPYRAASPIYQVRPGLPPTLLIYGDRDHVVDFGYAQTFRDALRAHGDDVTFVAMPWTEHGYEEVSFGLHAPIALRAVEEFLQRTLHQQ